ncbi:MAG: prepilin-type N-terminal cleavage/methylation domain-containing protein [Planctomycetota bacterium]
MRQLNTSTNLRRRARSRRGFNLVEMLLALAISAALLTATMVALRASFNAYQRTTEMASTHTISRLAMHRMLTLIRTGQEFGPFPLDPLETVVESDEIQFMTGSGAVMRLVWNGPGPLGDAALEDNSLYVDFDGQMHLLLGGVIAQYDPVGSSDEADRIPPFTLEYESGRLLYRATINLMIEPDDNLSTDIDQSGMQQIHLVASAMPRSAVY